MDVRGVASTALGMLALAFTNHALAAVPDDKLVATILSVPARNWNMGYSMLGVAGLVLFVGGIASLVKDVRWELESRSMTTSGAVGWGLMLLGLTSMAVYLFPWHWYLTVLIIGAFAAGAGRMILRILDRLSPRKT